MEAGSGWLGGAANDAPARIRSARNRLRNARGLTLVELMVAMLILVIFLAPALSGFVLAESETQRNLDAMIATDKAARTLEDIKDLASIHFFSDRLGADVADPTPQPIGGLSEFPSQQPPDPRFTVQAWVKVWATTPSGAAMQGVKEVTVKVFYAGNAGGAPLAEVSQWITQSGP